MTLTPEQFLALPADPEDEDQESEQLGPLESIADSLRCMHVLLERVAAIDLDNLDRTSPTEQAADEQRQRFDDLDQAYADLEAKHDVLRALVEEIQSIVKPSTSKLANSVRDAVQRWKAPAVPAAEPEQVDEEVCPLHGWAHKFKTCDEVTAEQSAAPAEDLSPPAADADVWEWRAYAIRLGHDNVEMGKLNRAQIRTMLGIEQPVNEVSA